MNYDSPSDINKILKKNGLALKKKFGQNFLVNRIARQRIVACLAPVAGETVWEIGPGLGAMTELILPRAGRVVCFEIDRGFIRILQDLYGGTSGFVLVGGDAVKEMSVAKARYGVPDRILGNLPYASASQIIAEIINTEITARRITVTVQKELGWRMKAVPGNKNYSSFSILCQTFFDITYEFDLKGGNFHPRPDVDSAVVSLVPRFSLTPGPGRNIFFKLIRSAFSSRRKTLFNNLLKDKRFTDNERKRIRAFCEARSVAGTVRAEELTPEFFRELAFILTTPESGTAT